MENEEIMKMRNEIVSQYDKVQKPVTDQITKEEVMLPVTDEYRLRTLIFKPEKFDRPLPTIVVRGCYVQQEEWLLIQMRELAKRGYAGVLQWCRGTGGSEGIWQPYIYERNDGLKLMNWLQDQTWVDSIGLVGASYLALVGWEIADIIPEKVKTMYLTVLGTEWHESLWQEGEFRQDVYTSWLMTEALRDSTMDYIESAKYRPQINVDVDLWHNRLDVYRDFISNPSPAAPYWTEGFWGTVKDVPSKMRIPVFIGEGWYDIHLGNMLRTYADLNEESRLHSVVQVNPGNHPLIPVIPGQEKQEHAAVEEYRRELQWFKDILVDHKIPDTSVDFYMIGEDQWRHYNTWPVPVSEYRSFWLDGGRMADAATESVENIENGSREYTYDPDNPVPSHGSGTLFAKFEGVGSLKQPEPDYRQDVLSYVSDELKEDLDIVGELQAELYVQSDAPDTAFTFKLMEVKPDGTAWNIRDGITTLGYRNSAKTKQSYDGSVVKILIKAWDIAYRVPKGSRLRVDISSSNFPEYNAHPNTAEDWAFAKEAKTANQKILTGRDYPSRIILPLDRG